MISCFSSVQFRNLYKTVMFDRVFARRVPELCNGSSLIKSSSPGADSICPERARSAGSRTALAPLQFRKMGCQNERRKLAQIRYQVTCYGIKLESGDLPRFFMIDEIDHARLEKKSRQTVCVREFVRTQWF